MHNSLLLISVAENKAYFQPTGNNSDSSPSFTFIPCVTHPEPKGDHFFSFLAHVGIYLKLYRKRKMCLMLYLQMSECYIFSVFLQIRSHIHGRIEALKHTKLMTIGIYYKWLYAWLFKYWNISRHQSVLVISILKIIPIAPWYLIRKELIFCICASVWKTRFLTLSIWNTYFNMWCSIF